jgi:hypothetical protein
MSVLPNIVLVYGAWSAVTQRLQADGTASPPASSR